ncbi:MAG: Tim44 domain-containing protein [Xanthobacteraceae bacterium]|jgi:predicted lipid-binding transport protein (Tim44 family)
MFRNKSLIAFLAVAATLAFVAVEAIAAPRMNSGSRGNRTYSAPPATQTAPNAARPIERSATTPRPNQPAAAPAARPTTPATQPGGMFGRFGGVMGGLAAGFLGAGLIGMLMGTGFMGGMAGFASMLGMMIQIGLVVLVAVLAWRWWQRRSQPQAAYAEGPAMNRDMSAGAPQERGSFLNGIGLNGSGSNGQGAPAYDAGEAIEIKPADYDAFERTLTEVQKAYGDEDVGALRLRMTPEMLSYFSEELSANAARGVVNKISDVKLLQGDLAEAWREGDDEYATVAMRYSQVDKLIERASGKVVQGGDTPDEGVEYWTFRRAGGGAWMVSAIQQTE